MEAGLQQKQSDLTLKVDQYTDMILRLALVRLGNRSDAQDVCQNVFMKLFKHRDPFRDPEHEKAWILKVTLNACTDLRRSAWKKRFLLFAETPDLYQAPVKTDVLSFVLGLPPKYRIVIHLYYYEGYQTPEIAELLSLKENTVRTQLKRAKELLKEKITEGWDDDEG